MDYGLTEDQEMIRESAGVFADEPNKSQGKAKNTTPPDWRILFG
jgi:hypothetical protein